MVCVLYNIQVINKDMALVKTQSKANMSQITKWQEKKRLKAEHKQCNSWHETEGVYVPPCRNTLILPFVVDINKHVSSLSSVCIGLDTIYFTSSLYRRHYIIHSERRHNTSCSTCRHT